MRLLITILFLFSVAAHATTTYYVSNSGSDAANGTSTTTPFQTIAKSISVAVPFDLIKLNADGIWIEQVFIPSYLTHLTFDSFGTGNKPLVTGFIAISGFTQSGNIWSTTASGVVDDLNCVLLNGTFVPKARYPNTGYLTFTSYQGDSIINTPETGTPPRAGIETIVKTATWIIDNTFVQNQVAGQLKLFPKLTTTPNLLGNGYFFQNDSTFLTAANRYTFKNLNKRLKVYSATTPDAKGSIFDTLVKCSDYTTFKNIDFSGANKLIMQLNNSALIKKCSFQYAGWDALQGDGIIHAVIDSCFICDAWNNGITHDWFDQQHKLNVTHTTIKRIGLAAGMGKSGNGTYIGIIAFSDSTSIKYNTIDSIGYNGTHTSTYPTNVDSNHITHCCLTKTDGGDMYTFYGAPGNTFIGNIAGDNPGNPDGISGNNIAVALYLDNNTQGQIINRNTLFNSIFAAAFVHAGFSGNQFTNNILDDSIGIPFYDNGTPGLSLTSNIFNSRDASVDAFNMDNAIGHTIDNNWYIRPKLPTGLIRYGSLYNYNTFPSEAHGKTMPVYCDVHYSPILVVNPTMSDSTIALDQTKTYVDVNGRLYTNSITLHAYETALLYQSTLSRIDKIYVPSIQQIP
jgi:hypothetical protein